MTAARAAVATPAAKPAARTARTAAGARQPVQIEAAPPDTAGLLRPSSRCVCGGGCPRCTPSRAAGGERSSTDLPEREAQATGARMLQWPASRSTVLASTGTHASRADSAAPASARQRARTLPPATGPPATRRRPIATTAGPRSLAAGRSLTAVERERFELPLARDLSGVRVHDGPPAEAAAAEQHAHAFTYGSHVVLGRAAQRAPESMRLAVLAHELVHVGQQASALAANDDRFDHQARAPPHREIVPHLSPAPLGVMCLSEDDDSIIPRWASDAAGAVADAGAGAFDAAAEAAGSAAEFALDTAAVVVDQLAPGLLPFLRGGALGQLTDLFCSGIDALLGTLFSSLGDIDFMSAIETAFSGLAEGVRGVQAEIGGTASAALGTVLGPLVKALQAWGGPLVETIQSVATTVNEMFSGVWDGLAVPALDMLQRFGGAIWQDFNDLVGWVWDLAAPIRTGAETAWNWLIETFDLAWDSTSGVRDWLGEMASAAWTAFLETIEPIREPLMVAGGIALLLSPVGPIVVLTQVVPPLWEKITWLWNNWNTKDILVRAQDVLRDDILPAILGKVSGVASAIGGAASWLAGLVGEFGGAMSGVLGALGANRCLTAVTTYLNGVAGQFDRLAAWAASGFEGLSEALQAMFDALVGIFQPIMDFLVRLAMVAANPPMLPFAIAGAIWLLCPDELKPPVIDFVLDLLIAFVDGSTVFLIGVGPMAFVLQAGVLGFLRELRGGQNIDDQRRIDASDKVANLGAGGGPAFVLGFALGFLHGVIDGVIDPFRLIFLIGSVLVAGAQAIGRALAPFVLSTVPGAATAVAGMRGSLALPPSTAPPAAAPAQGTIPDASGATATSAAAGTASEAEAPTAAPTGAGASAEELPPLEAMPGDRNDAEIASVLGPGMAAEVAAAAAEPSVDETALAVEMRGEMETEGATVGGLARLLGDAWEWIMRGSEGLGRSAANAFIDFILLPDFQLGRKLGFVTGFLALQALIIYLTVGGYAALEATGPLWRQLLALFLRFLDLGGEILGLLGRALRPLRAPLMRGLGAARGLLSRFRFARGLIERIERLAGTLFRFGDEAAAVGSRGAREVAEETGERAAREAVEETGERAAREGAEGVGERAAREGAEEAGERGGRETAEESAERSARHAAERPAALAAAQAIAQANDRIDTPIPLLLVELTVLKARFDWIRRFEARPVGLPGHYSIRMIASDDEVDDYTVSPHVRDVNGKPVVESYGDMRGNLPTGHQANHINQNAAFRDAIPHSDGAAVAMRGNAFTEVGTPHYNFHESLEGFWNEFRPGGARLGEVPTCAEYDEAVREALSAGDFTPEEAAEIAAEARRNREAHHLFDDDPVPRIPGRLGQRPRPEDT